MVALQRYSASLTQPDGATAPLSHAHVATGLMDAEGNELPPNKSVRVALHRPEYAREQGLKTSEQLADESRRIVALHK